MTIEFLYKLYNDSSIANLNSPQVQFPVIFNYSHINEPDTKSRDNRFLITFITLYNKKICDWNINHQKSKKEGKFEKSLSYFISQHHFLICVRVKKKMRNKFSQLRWKFFIKLPHPFLDLWWNCGEDECWKKNKKKILLPYIAFCKFYMQDSNLHHSFC